MTANRTALITGASRGIGAASARIFAENGYDLILTCDKSMDALEELAELLAREFGIRCDALQADMSDEEAVARIYTHVDRLDVLVNNAGISHVGLLSDMTSGQWHRVMGVNLDSCFYTAKAAIPLMLREHSGHIINISSVWGCAGASMEVAYSTSKGGMNAFTKALAKELAPSGIRVNAIACGVIDTAMNACFTPEDMEHLRDEIPSDRLGQPEEVARLVLQLTQGPAYLTGQVIALDGGWL
ncbi:MAG: SDR family oxidoreductase [Clostridium sp.]|nr:SDR family oxidoreductase [Acetatifactor muris]MCM1526988.1 SDR family oxidoreductase [Bacteroides sp.]MCM1563151.1 SDR family oxidoreductase [Clostridium sp.]